LELVVVHGRFREDFRRARSANRYFERLRREADDVACVIVELIQGTAGVLPADRAFVQELRAVCDECGVLLIVDEVMTGFASGSLVRPLRCQR
jgi:4-aminobutyrate aminotransferase-like enzyme